MLFAEKGEEAKALAAQAMEAMQAHGIPPNPMNFTVWYAHCSGRHPELSRTIEAFLQQDEGFTPARNEEIFESFFGNDGQADAVRATSKQIEGVTHRVIEDLRAAGVDVASFGDKLAAFGSDLQAGGDLATLIQEMLRETEAARARTQALEAQLNVATGEIQELRKRMEDVRLEALTDGLTGLYNRKHFDAQLRRDALKAMEICEPLCVILCDIDHFKRFNDTYGHAIGDEVIKLVARTLKQNVQGRDTPARYGGEEFAVILPQTGLQDAAVLAERIRGRLAGKELKTKNGGRSFGKVTMSLGLAEYRLGEPLTDLIQRADAALYAAKRDGRNRVATEATDMPAAVNA